MRLSWPLSRFRASRSTPAAKRIAATNAHGRAGQREPVGDDEARERGGSDRVRVEGQPAQHDPGAEQPGRDREQEQLDEAALDEHEVEGR